MTQEQKKFIEKIETIIDNWDSLVEWKKDTTEHCILPEHYKGIVRDIKLELTSLDNWISVEDGLPKDDDDVLIFIDDGYTEKNLSSLGNFINSEWLINGRNEKTIAGMAVTHWQPLPQPPKQALIHVTKFVSLVEVLEKLNEKYPKRIMSGFLGVAVYINSIEGKNVAIILEKHMIDDNDDETLIECDWILSDKSGEVPLHRQSKETQDQIYEVLR